VPAVEHLVIIGNGIAGTTIACEVRKRKSCRITLISNEAKSFFSRPALMYVFMGQLTLEQTQPYPEKFWADQALERRLAKVCSVRAESRCVLLDSGETLNYDQLVIASGSRTRFPPVRGLDAKGVQGFYGLADLQSMEAAMGRTRSAVIVGGGLIGVELAEMLLSRGKNVTMLVRETHPWGSVLPAEEGNLVAQQMRSHGLNLKCNSQLGELHADAYGYAQSITTQSGEALPCQWLGLATGVQPNIEFLHGSGIPTRSGVLVDPFLATCLPGVYACGDCAEITWPGATKVETVWYTGRRQAEALAQTLCGRPTRYDPGIWFNSAKFFDLEYQVYGRIPPRMDNEHFSFYWQNPEGNTCLRMVGNRKDGTLTGVHAFGIRLAHQVCSGWIAGGAQLTEAVHQFARADFSSEFSPRHGAAIQASFLAQFPPGSQPWLQHPTAAAR
jgi:NAD(P)H-nitrite reductase large subunit